MGKRLEAVTDRTTTVTGVHRRRTVAGTVLALAVMSLLVATLGAQQLTPVAVELVSINIFGTSGNAASNGVAVNIDGSFVAFYSDATDLIPGDINQMRDVFLRDRARDLTERVSVNNAGDAGNRPSHATGFPPAIDADGQIVAFYSDATNLVPDDTNDESDVFVRLRTTATTERVSLGAGGTQSNGPSFNPSINGDGQLVAFQSQASNLAPNDNNGLSDIFVRDRGSATTERICDAVEPNGGSFAPSISANGLFVAFTSAATNLVPRVPDTNGHLDIFVCDRSTGALDLVSVSSDEVQGNDDSILPAISEDGRFVAFKSLASNLVKDDRNGLVDVFVRDRAAGTTERVSVNFIGGDSNDVSFPPSISYAGRFVAFGSAASNLVRADQNQLPSVFVRDEVFQLSLLVDVNARGEQANGGTLDVPPSVSGDGRQIGYVSFASNLAGPDANETADVFIAGNPFFCPDNRCPPDLMCRDGMCEPNVVPTDTPTPGRNCCQCEDNTCSATSGSTCPTGCNLVTQAACLGTGNCATFTPTATATATVRADDCCQCPGNTCSAPSDGVCPAGCNRVLQAVCLSSSTCATFTATATTTPTPTPTGPTATPTATSTERVGADCCQCADNTCAVPSDGVCPAGCTLVPQAACLGSGTCATFTATATTTPTPTPTGPTATPTATSTGTVGADCCQCAGNTCAAPSDGVCPAGCTLVPQAVCLSTGTCATFTPGRATATATATITPTFTPTGPTVTPTAPLGPTDCCQCTENSCVVPSSGSCPSECDPVRQAACLGTGQCATFTPLRSVTATPTTTASPATRTPTSTQTPETTPFRPLDQDACQCAVTPSPQRTRRGVMLWLSGPVMLMLRRLRRRRPLPKSTLDVIAGLIWIASSAVPPAQAEPFLGVDVGASTPTNGNYRAHVKAGATLNPYIGYMFNRYVGVQGQVHIVYQGTDFHSDFSGNPNQVTSMVGGTAGPRFELPFPYPFGLGEGEIYATAQGGYFVGLSGRLSHSAPGFSAGMGIGYKLMPSLTLEVFGRWNTSFMSPRPKDLGPGQVPQERFGRDIEWATGGLGLKYAFLQPEAPPSPPPPVAELPPAAPVERQKIVLRNVNFDFDRFNIRPDAAPVLDEAVVLLKDLGEVSIVAEGNTDSIGTEAYNMGLSQRRADSVRNYLVEHGIAADRIRTEAFGESRPVAPNDTADGRAQNRRVELRPVP